VSINTPANSFAHARKNIVQGAADSQVQYSTSPRYSPPPGTAHPQRTVDGRRRHKKMKFRTPTGKLQNTPRNYCATVFAVNVHWNSTEVLLQNVHNTGLKSRGTVSLNNYNYKSFDFIKPNGNRNPHQARGKFWLMTVHAK
jgi:hypothetical protein